MFKLSIVVPVYYNAENLWPLYRDLKEKVLDCGRFTYELLLVDDGSKDRSWAVIQELAAHDKNVRGIKLSRNFGSHAAQFCGLAKSTGDCVVVKAADMQEPSELILQMVDSWEKGNHIVLAVREDREDGRAQSFFANFYYWITQKTALPQMPTGGFDVELLDRKVVDTLGLMAEKNSPITGQILWSGFQTDTVSYVRKKREIGESRWTLKKKIRLVSDTLFSFSTVPITFVTAIGTLSFFGSIAWAIIEVGLWLSGKITVEGWTTMFIFNLFSFGTIMLTLGLLGGYLWRTFDASRGRPLYIVEDELDLR